MDATLKQQLRSNAHIHRTNMAPEMARLKSEAICRVLTDWVSNRKSEVVHAFLPMTGRGEPNILPFIEAALAMGVRFIVPEVLPGQLAMNHHWYRKDTQLTLGKWGVSVPVHKDPADPQSAQVVLVPMLAVDLRGYRVGFGKGYYDFFLSRIDATFVGVCFDDEIVDFVPNEPHDVPIHYIVTENRVISTVI